MFQNQRSKLPRSFVLAGFERQRTVSPLNSLNISARMPLSAHSRQNKGMAIRDNKEGYVRCIWQPDPNAIRGLP
jgi:hypothetical protein